MIEHCNSNATIIPWLVRRVEQLACQVQQLEKSIGGGNYPIVVQVGTPGGPIAGTNTFTIPFLQGYTWLVMKNGQGTMIQGEDYTGFPNGTVMLLDGNTFQDQEVYTYFYY